MDREGINILEFHDSGQRNLLIAAAGHGKTYTISELASINKNALPYLILTHTHAGVASLKDKMVKRGIDSHQYVLTTIHAFCQSMILAYVSNYENIPSREDNTTEFYKYLCVKATQLVCIDVVKSTIIRSYSGVIIDEYQDCNMEQHKFALELSKIIPLRAFGDPLQCIFDFKDTCVDFNTDFQGFNRFEFLNTPWRWINSGNTLLGEKILKCRDHLLNRVDNNFRLVDDPQANFRVLTNFDVNSINYLQDVGRFIRAIKSDSLLIIIPTYIKYKGRRGINTSFCNIELRADLRSRMGLSHGFSLLESIDDKDFYRISQLLDSFFNSSFETFESFTSATCKILETITLGVSNIKDYIKDNGKFIKKGDECKNKISSVLQNLFYQTYTKHDRKYLAKIAKYFHYDLHTTVKRPELFYDLIAAIESSHQEKSILECMIEKRNLLRRQGRKVKGKAIGTTLLTKGLEFDSVVVFQADMIADRRNFYVAISRASRDVYLITNSEKIALKP